MPLSRPVMLALIGAILAMATLFATQGARNQASNPEPAANAEAAKPAKPAPKPAAKPAKPAAKPAEPVAAAPKAEVKPKPKPKPSKPAATKPVAAAPDGLPAPVARAVRSGNVTVLFFRQAGGADDAATARAVAGQRGRKGVSVFSADIRHLNRYRAVVADLGLSQAPAVVILGKDRNARVLEGFIDPETLAQEVTDSR